MNRKDAYRIGVRLLGLYFAAQCIVGLGYTFSAYWTAAMMTTSPTTLESFMDTMKTAPSTFAYPIACGLAALILLVKTRSIVKAFERSDEKSDGQLRGA